MSANETQVGGAHYRTQMQHWDYVWVNDLDYFQGQITKYVTRWKKKNGIQDLKKAQHFLNKYLELVEGEESKCNCGYPMAHLPGCPQYNPETEATKHYVNQD